MRKTECAIRAGVAVLFLSLSACGGAGGEVASIPAPPLPAPTPTPTPTPPPSPIPPPVAAVALLAPARTLSPSPPIATAAAPSIAAPVGQVTFPLLQTAVTIDYRRRPAFSGDAVTTGQGATLNLDAATGRFGLTINNSDLNIVDATASTDLSIVDGFHRVGTPIPGDRSLWTRISTLDYMAFGSWLLARFPPGEYEWINGGTFLGGYATPAGAIPTSGTATYTGTVDGLYDESGQPPGDVAILMGDVSVTANFATRDLSGVMSNLRLGSDWVRHGTLNDIAFDARFDPATNMFSGSTRVTTQPGGLTAFAENASGVISGLFFGPSANEVGGVWNLSDHMHRLVGSFGAKRN